MSYLWAVLDDFIATQRDEIIRRARQKASSRSNLQPNDSDLDKGIPLFLDQLVATLNRSASGARDVPPAADPSTSGVRAPAPVSEGHATAHGGNLQRMGFSIAQVVHGYGDVCQTVTELAIERDASITVDDFRLFNRCLDDAIADAVTEYEKQREASVAGRGTERVAVLAHELRNSLHTAMLAFGVMKRGAVGPDSSTMAVLNRSLTRLHDLLERSIAQVRLESGAPQLERITLATLIEDAEIASALEASNRGVTFSVSSTAGVEVEGDRLLLAGAIANLLNNAFKFTHVGGHVTLATRVVSGRALIDIEDACGGLPVEKAEELFRFFEQRSTDRSGLGVGLPVSRQSVRAMNGDIHVRGIPSKGCVFTIDLPLASSKTR
jgi:signal transduction histidine kinase